MLVLLTTLTLCSSGSMCFVRGDANGDGSTNIADATYLYAHLFCDGPTLHLNLDAADANDDGGINIADVVHILRHLFAGAECPPPNGETSDGTDQSPDEINPLYDWAVGRVLWEDTRSYGFLEGDGQQNQWPEKTATTTSWTSPKKLKGQMLTVKTNPAGQYDSLFNSWRVENLPTSPLHSRTFHWAGFGLVRCACRNSIRIDWAIEHLLKAAQGSMTYEGQTTLWSNACNVTIALHLRNTTRDELAEVSRSVPMGRLSLSVVSDMTEAIDEIQLADSGGHDVAWSFKHASSNNGMDLYKIARASGSEHFVIDDLGFVARNWRDTDRIKVEAVKARNGWMSHIPKTMADATLSDAVRVKVGLSAPTLDVQEE